MLSNILLALNITLMYSSPLIFTALGSVISEQSGVVNIGLEGMMVMGAFTGAAVGYYTSNPWIGLLAAGAAGGVMAVFHAIASVTFKGNQTISGVAINFIGPGLSLFLCRYFFDGATMTKPLPHKLPKLFNVLGIATKNNLLQNFNIDISTLIAFALTAAVYFVLYKTKWGLRLRAVGEHPAAADTLGIDVTKVRYAAVIISGILAGMGGAAQSMSVVSMFTQTVISGHGFIGMAAAIFGKWTPHGAMLACMLFGFAQALVAILGGGSLIPTQILSMLPYLLTILMLVLFVGRARAPKASGVPYQKGSR